MSPIKRENQKALFGEDCDWKFWWVAVLPHGLAGVAVLVELEHHQLPNQIPGKGGIILGNNSLMLEMDFQGTHM